MLISLGYIPTGTFIAYGDFYLHSLGMIFVQGSRELYAKGSSINYFTFIRRRDIQSLYAIMQEKNASMAVMLQHGTRQNVKAKTATA